MNPPNECLKEKPRKIVFCHQKLYSNEKKHRHIMFPSQTWAVIFVSDKHRKF